LTKREGVGVKRRYVVIIIGVAVFSLIVGGIKLAESKPFTWFDSEPGKATLGDQRVYLQKHEAELTEKVEKINPKVTSVQFDWDSIDAGAVGNGLPWGDGEVLEIRGRFNHIEDSQFNLQFVVSEKTELPDIKTAVSPGAFMVAKGRVWVIYE
jgi:hypothetical protein